MQCSAWRPTSSASTCGAAGVEQHEMELARAVVLAHPGPDRRVRVHPLGGRGARQQLQHDLEVAPRRQHLLDPHQGDQHLRQRRAHAPVALGLDDADRARLGDAEVRAADRDGHGEELLAQVAAGRLGDRARLEPQLLPLGDRALEQRRDLGAVAVDRGDEDVGLLVVAQLDDQLGEVGLDRLDAAQLERLVEPDLVRDERLDLDHLVGAVLARDAGDDRVRLGAVARPVHDAARARHARLEPLELLGERRHRVRLDRRAGVAQRLPVVELGDGVRALDPDRRRRLAEVAAQLRVGERGARRLREAGAHSCAARISAKCITRTPARWRASAAADVHQAGRVDRRADLGARVEHRAQLVAEHRHRRVGVLDRERAAEAAALHAVPELDEVDAAHGAQQPLGPVADPERAHGVAGRVQRDAVRERGADVLDAEHVHEELRQLVDRRTRERDAHAAVVVAHEADARRARRDDRLRVPEHALEALGERPRVVLVARVAVHLPAAGLLRGEVDLAAEPLEQRRPSPAPRPGRACR